MIIEKVIQRSISPYGKFFLAIEAPGDEETPRKNVKVVKAVPDNRRRKDYTDYEDDDDAGDNNTEPEINEVSTEETDGPITDDNEYSDMEDNETDAEENQDEEVVTDDESYDDEDEDSENPNDSISDADETGDNDGNEEEGPATDEGEYSTDDTADVTDDGSDSETAADDNGNTDSGEESGDGAGIDYESTRKYVLYRDFMSLYTASDNYISKLENSMYDDLETNQVIKIATNNLREVRDSINEYLIIKFKSASYVQSMLYYQNTIVTIQLIFKMIDSVYKSKQEESKK